MKESAQPQKHTCMAQEPGTGGGMKGYSVWACWKGPPLWGPPMLGQRALNSKTLAPDIAWRLRMLSSHRLSSGPAATAWSLVEVEWGWVSVFCSWRI